MSSESRSPRLNLSTQKYSGGRPPHTVRDGKEGNWDHSISVCPTDSVVGVTDR